MADMYMRFRAPPSYSKNLRSSSGVSQRIRGLQKRPQHSRCRFQYTERCNCSSRWHWIWLKARKRQECRTNYPHLRNRNCGRRAQRKTAEVYQRDATSHLISTTLIHILAQRKVARMPTIRRAKTVPQNVPQLDPNQALHARYAAHAR
jgi:hypothetical protein